LTEVEEDQQITCPHCWQLFPIRLDLTVSGQTFVYDCEICCNPLEVNYQVEDGSVVSCEAVSLEQ
jgi:hypothetical protein